jgi:oxygen-dependent protoporphyrinogen oxidase
MFPGRAPQGHVLFETLVGGRRHPERLKLDKDELVARALADVREILNIREQPLYTAVLRSDGGIPQLEQGYGRLLAWRDELVRTSCGLSICGFGWEGIGINDMLKTASRVAEAILNATAGPAGAAEVKKVYF